MLARVVQKPLRLLNSANVRFCSAVSSIPKDEHFVVVGGGYGGCAMAGALLKAGAKCTLISNRETFYHNVGSPRALTEEGFNKKCFIPLAKTFGPNFKLGKVTAIDPEAKQVVLDEGEKISYSSLIMATGKSGSFPYAWDGVEQQDAMNHLDAMRHDLEKANRILVIGGGPTGVEQAAEIAVKWPAKEVTILNDRHTLIMPGLSDNFYNRLDELLDQLKVNVIRGEVLDTKTMTTDKGRKVEADYILKSVGLFVDPSPYKNGLGSAVTERGQLKVNDYLEVDGFEDVYAVGDCNTRGPALAYAANEQASLLVKNLEAKHSGKELGKWDDDGLPIKIIMSVGPNHGIGQFPDGSMFPEATAQKMKSSDLMVGLTWGGMGQEVPS